MEEFKKITKVVICSYNVFQLVTQLKARNWRKIKNYDIEPSSYLSSSFIIINAKGKMTTVVVKNEKS